MLPEAIDNRSSAGRRNMQLKDVSRIEENFEKFVLISLMASHALMFSPYLDAVVPGIYKVFIGYFLLLIFAFSLFGIIRGKFVLTCLSVIPVVCLLIYQQLAFSDRYNVPINLNSIFPFVAICSYAILVQMKMSLNKKLDAILYFANGYAVFYMICYAFFIVLKLAPVDGIIVAGEGDGRSDRLLGAAMYLCAGATIACSRIFTNLHNARRAVVNFGLMVLPISAALLAQSRFIVAAFVISGIIVFALNIRGFGRIRAGLATVLAVAVLFCLGAGINIYTPFRDEDLSSRSRYLVFDLAHEIIDESPWTGIGISDGAKHAYKTVEMVDDPKAPSKYNRKIGLYPSDLSFMGWWLQFGALGTLLLVIAIPFCVNGKSDPLSSKGSLLAFRIIGLATALYAPSNVGGSATILFAFMLAEHIVNRRPRRFVALPQAGPQVKERVV